MAVFLITGDIEGNAKEKGALIYSLLIPGGGQFYNGQYLKGAVLGGAVLYFELATISDFVKYRRELKRYRDTDDPASKTRYESYFKSGMSNLLSFLGIWGYSLLDAYVNSKLHDFDGEKEKVLRLKLSSNSVGFEMDF